MSNLHLAVEISDDFVRFITLRDASVRDRLEHPLSGKTDADRKEVLSNLFREHSFLQGDFENITLAWCNNKSALVPNAVFNESTPEDLFKLCFGSETDKKEIDYNRISELGIINVYQIPDWIKSFFVLKYPRVVIQHAGTHMVRKNLNDNAFYLKATIVCFDNYFRLTLVKHNNLEFYSSFDYQSAEDIVYHLSFALQQKELMNEKGNIELIAAVGSDPQLAESVADGLKKIGELKDMKVHLDHEYLSKSQLLCV